jgi:hypothetical protein
MNGRERRLKVPTERTVRLISSSGTTSAKTISRDRAVIQGCYSRSSRSSVPSFQRGCMGVTLGDSRLCADDVCQFFCCRITQPLASYWMRVVSDACRISRHDPDRPPGCASPRLRPVIGVVGQQPMRLDCHFPVARPLRLFRGYNSVDGYSFFETPHAFRDSNRRPNTNPALIVGWNQTATISKGPND